MQGFVTLELKKPAQVVSAELTSQWIVSLWTEKVHRLESFLEAHWQTQRTMMCHLAVFMKWRSPGYTGHIPLFLAYRTADRTSIDKNAAAWNTQCILMHTDHFLLISNTYAQHCTAMCTDACWHIVHAVQIKILGQGSYGVPGLEGSTNAIATDAFQGVCRLYFGFCWNLYFWKAIFLWALDRTSLHLVFVPSVQA